MARKNHVVDLTTAEFPTSGDVWNYELHYTDYLDRLHGIAQCSGDAHVAVHGAPWCWGPLLYHLNCEIVDPRVIFKHCNLVRSLMMQVDELDRTAIEVLCGFRPETVDALWKLDCQWEVPFGRVRSYPPSKDFIVTTNGAYYRPEVQEYAGHLAAYEPKKKNVLLVPCSGNKPYPSPVHKACMKIMPHDFYLCSVTGVVGLAPQELWDVMPHYDAGIPNFWHVYETVETYFSEHEHDRVVVYVDFYANVLSKVFDRLRGKGKVKKVAFVFPPLVYPDYLNLTALHHLEKLRRVFRGEI